MSFHKANYKKLKIENINLNNKVKMNHKCLLTLILFSFMFTQFKVFFFFERSCLYLNQSYKLSLAN